MKETRIPIRNLYLMLAYSWEELPIINPAQLESHKFENSTSFFAELLIHILPELKKRGILQSYVETTEESRSIRGKLDFGMAVKRMLLESGRTSCSYDVFSEDIPPNQILKWALRTLISSKDLEKDIRSQLVDHLAFFERVRDVFASKHLFKSIRYHRGNSHYRFAINLSELLFDLSLPGHSLGDVVIPNFFRDERAMSRIFEGFIRNFYRAEQVQYSSVKSEVMEWDARANRDALSFLPQMRTDITLSSATSVKIIDAKFYSKTFEDRYGSQKLKAENLYQLLSYLRTKSRKGTASVSGMLLYPEVGQQVDLEYHLEGFPVRVATIDLAANWESIKARLLERLLKEIRAGNVA